jgi:hypothetical protein
MKQIDNYNEYTTVLERIFPWTQSGATIRIPNKTCYNKLMKDQTNDEYAPPTISQTVLKKTDKPQLNNEEVIVNNEEVIVNNEGPIINNKQRVPLTDSQKAASVFKMWNLIESVGIKRDMLEKVFPTYEATSELYSVIENRIHQEGEQEMIKRLRLHVAKLNEHNKTKKEVTKEVNT